MSALLLTLLIFVGYPVFVLFTIWLWRTWCRAREADRLRRERDFAVSGCASELAERLLREHQAEVAERARLQ